VDRNLTREKLARGQTVFGCLLRYPDAGLAELLALQGFDLIVFDGEHGALTPQLCEHLVRAVQLHGVTPAVRVEENRAASILRYLDAGVLACQVPRIESAEEAAAVVRAVKFGPEGDRGLSASRASGFGAGGDYPGYIAEANRESQVIVQLESAAALAAADEIAAVEGVDVLFVGTLDLSQELGCPGEVQHPTVVAAAERIEAAARASGKVFGTVASDADSARAWIERGARYVLATVESLLVSGLDDYLVAARGGAEREAARC
jgi:4-hydroxy-2-oxoheptanedioate aldolase